MTGERAERVWQVGGTVIEVTKRGREAVLDKEIASALAGEPKTSKPASTAKLKTRKRPFSREVKLDINRELLCRVTMVRIAVKKTT